MSPPSAIETASNGDGSKPSHAAPLEPGLNEAEAKVKMPKFPGPPKFDDPYKERAYLKGRLAAAFRIFGKYGFDEGVAGHITLRDPVDPTTFWVNPFGVAFSMMKASDLILVNEEGEVIDGGPCRLLNSAAYMIHSAIHQARPDVAAAAHSHSIYGRSFCSLGRTLDTITQDSCAFHNDHVLYASFNGIVLAQEEGKNIAKALGDKKAALLQNHGLLTVGKTIEETVFWFVSLEKCCHAQLMADAAAAGRGGETVKIGEEDAQFTYKTVGTPMAGWFSAKPLFDVIHKETNGEYLE
ncbi:class II aldolase/adducin domain-containing protein [Corynespora cassiicola Philippines]|uniref:Class II aldolase/adducin domain-containing protein n=1 Tax=Corynespora cassiicola Philippines TaxID=1448308 RepID=A0A2T2N6H8_CORCC|nr:class II aldolase/adducin domain-containing protein [Corynespora cassiicola Philippines]